MEGQPRVIRWLGLTSLTCMCGIAAIGWRAAQRHSVPDYAIAFTSHRSGPAKIYRVHPDGSGLERLTDGPAFDDQAALSPDGKTLAFVSSRSGQADIWKLDLAKGKVVVKVK